MADAQIGNELGVAAKGGNNLNGGTAVDAGLFLTNSAAQTIASLKARLTAFNATSYTPARLAAMSYNDLVYAVRVSDQPTSI